MKIAFLFAGQGSQTVGMGHDLYETLNSKEIFDQYPEIRDLCFNGPDTELNQTKNAQKAIVLESIAVADYLTKQGIKAEITAGLSLGEYSALYYANVLTLKDAIEIITVRGEIMQNALPLGTSTMAAIIGLTADKILPVLDEIEGVVEIANYNCPGQIVITGEVKAVEEAMVKLKEAGARRCLKLNVSGAFHSSLLKDASVLLREELNKHEFNTPSIPVVCNTYGAVSDEDVKDVLQKQIMSSVRMEQSIKLMIEMGFDTFVEIGPGTALSGFVKKISSDVKIYNTNTLEAIDTIVKELK